MKTTNNHINELNSLIALAVKDAVLTPVERKTIVNKGVEYGISADEVNSMLDNALRERISHAPKSSLKSCPDCGAQIPLISDFCPYCGHHYESLPSGKIENQSAEAKIIESENVRVEEERFAESMNCSKCGHPYPLISNVCPYCGNVLFHSDDHDLSGRKLSDNIRHEIGNIENMPRISVWMFLKYRITWVFMLLGIMMLMYFLHYSQLISLLAFLLFMFCGLPFNGLRKTAKEGRKALMEEYNEQYYGFMSKIKLFESQIHNFYGENAEARDLLSNLKSRLQEVVSDFSARRKRSYLIIVALLIAFVALFVALPRLEKVPYTIADNVKEYPIDWQLFDNYKVIDENHSFFITDDSYEYYKLDSQAVLSVSYWQESNDESKFDGDSDDNFFFRINGLGVSYVYGSDISTQDITFYLSGCDADGNELAQFYVEDWSPFHSLGVGNRGPIGINFSTYNYPRLNDDGNDQIQAILDLFNSIETYTLIFSKPE